MVVFDVVLAEAFVRFFDLPLRGEIPNCVGDASIVGSLRVIRGDGYRGSVESALAAVAMPTIRLRDVQRLVEPDCCLVMATELYYTMCLLFI